MSAGPLTLKTFFCADPAAPIAESCDMNAVRKAVEHAGSGLPPLTRKTLMKSVAGALDQFFQIGLDDILESAWDRVEAVRDIKAASRTDPDRLIPFPLLDHKISSSQQPHIDLLVGGLNLGRLPFRTAVSLKLRGVHIVMGGGRIHHITAGQCGGEATFTLGGVTLIERTTPHLALPGRLSFGRATTAHGGRP